MNILLCCLHVKTLGLNWTGANKRFGLFRKNPDTLKYMVLKINADKQPIGKYA
jgi:hypothetical protein